MFFRSFLCLSALVFVMLLASCEDSDIGVDTLLTIDVPESFSPDSNHELWVLITDSENNLVVGQPVTEDNQVFNRPKDFTDKRFNVHLLYVSVSPEMPGMVNGYMESYLGTSGKTLRLGVPEQDSPSPVAHTFSITDVPEYFTLRRFGQNYIPTLLYPEDGMLSGQTSSVPNTPFLYWIFNDFESEGVPRYRYIENTQGGQNLNVSFNNLEVAEATLVTLGNRAVTSGETIIRVAPDEPGWTSYFGIQYTYGESFTNVFYPGDLFNSYFTSITINNSNKSYVHQAWGDIPSAFEEIEATIVSLTGSGQTFTLNTTGSYDYANMYGNSGRSENGEGYSMSWDVTMSHASRAFTVPLFPAALIEKYPGLALATADFYYVTLGDYDTADDYDDFINIRWNPDGPRKYQHHLITGRSISVE